MNVRHPVKRCCTSLQVLLEKIKRRGGRSHKLWHLTPASSPASELVFSLGVLATDCSVLVSNAIIM